MNQPTRYNLVQGFRGGVMQEAQEGKYVLYHAIETMRKNPVAWVDFTDTGLVRFWSFDQGQANGHELRTGRKCVALGVIP